MHGYRKPLNKGPFFLQEKFPQTQSETSVPSRFCDSMNGNNDLLPSFTFPVWGKFSVKILRFVLPATYV